MRGRPWPSVSSREIEHGVPLFLTQLSETLRLEATATPFSSDAIGSTAARHGAELLARASTSSQVVHDYGDICQAITEIALEQNAPITRRRVPHIEPLPRHGDRRSGHGAHAADGTETVGDEEVERLGQAAHELRDLLNTALLAFQTLKRGTVAINGSTGAVLGRSLTSLRDLIDRTLSEVRLAAAGDSDASGSAVTAFVDEIAATGMLHSEQRRHPVHCGAGRSRVGR